MMTMKNHLLSLVIASVCIFSPLSMAWADDNQPQSQVSFTLTADNWVTSHSAEVTIAVHALLTQDQLADAQSNILHSLRNISAKGEWKIIQMQRTQNQANLEQLEILAQARLPNDALTDLRAAAKQESKQGETYEIQSMDYSPTNDELEAAQANLRSKIYEMAKAELQRLNSVFNNQSYILFSINFNNPQPIQPMYQKVNMIETAEVRSDQSAVQNANVSQHLTLTGQVVLSQKS